MPVPLKVRFDDLMEWRVGGWFARLNMRIDVPGVGPVHCWAGSPVRVETIRGRPLADWIGKDVQVEFSQGVHRLPA